jgi:hypothetical protein
MRNNLLQKNVGRGIVNTLLPPDKCPKYLAHCYTGCKFHNDKKSNTQTSSPSKSSLKKAPASNSLFQRKMT